MTLQKFYLVFSKNFVVFEKRPFKFFPENLPLKNFLLFGKVFIFIQTMVFDLLKLLLCWFPLKLFRDLILYSLKKRNSMKIWDFHILETTHDFVFCPCGKTPPKPPLLLVINLSSLSQLIQASSGFYSNFLSPQIISANYLEPERFSK